MKKRILSTNTTVDPSGTMPAYAVEGISRSGEKVYYTERGTQAGSVVPNNWSRAERYGCPADAQATCDILNERHKGITWSVVEAVNP